MAVGRGSSPCDSSLSARTSTAPSVQPRGGIMGSAFLLVGAIVLALLGPGVRLLGLHLSPLAEVVIFGLSIVGAAAVLSWATEVAQLDVSRALAFSVLALIA